MREGRSHDELRLLEIVPDYVEQAHGSALICLRAHPGAVHRDDRGGRAALACRKRPGLAHGRVRDAARPRPRRGRRARRAPASRRGERSRSSGSSVALCGPRTRWTCSASGRSGSTATSSRRTEARAPRPSPASGSRLPWRRRVTGWPRPRTMSAAVSVGLVEDDAAARSRLHGGRRGRCRHERRHDRRRPADRGTGDGGGDSVRAGTARRAARARGEGGSPRSSTRQREVVAGRQ